MLNCLSELYLQPWPLSSGELMYPPAQPTPPSPPHTQHGVSRSFPVADVTNYHTLCGQEQQNFFFKILLFFLVVESCKFFIYFGRMLCAKLLQSCRTLCDPMDCNPPGSSVHGILQARTLESVAKTSSRGKREILSLTAVEARNLKSRCPQGHAPSDSSGRESVLTSSSFWWRLGVLGPQVFFSCGYNESNLSLHLHKAFSPPCVSNLFLPFF